MIALASFFFFGVETGMFSILGLFLKAFVVDSVIEASTCASSSPLSPQSPRKSVITSSKSCTTALPW